MPLDFLSLMKQEIAKKSSAVVKRNLVTSEKKYFKRSEMYKRGYLTFFKKQTKILF